MNRNDNCQDAESHWTGRMLRGTAVLLLIAHIRIKGGDGRRVPWRKQCGEMSGMGGKAKWGAMHFCTVGPGQFRFTVHGQGMQATR